MASSIAADSTSVVEQQRDLARTFIDTTAAVACSFSWGLHLQLIARMEVAAAASSFVAVTVDIASSSSSAGLGSARSFNSTTQ